VKVESLVDAIRLSGGDGRHEYGASPV
jgi:hypothetical protein